MYSDEEINKLKEYKEGRMVSFFGDANLYGDYLIDTPERVLEVFYKILRLRFDNRFYLMPPKRSLLPKEIKKSLTETYDRLKKIDGENVFGDLLGFWNQWVAWEKEYETTYQEEYERWDNWHLRVYNYLQEENPDKWQAVLFLNEMHCEECKKDFDIYELKIV